jgi:hypothetical protein
MPAASSAELAALYSPTGRLIYAVTLQLVAEVRLSKNFMSLLLVFVAEQRDSMQVCYSIREVRKTEG